MRYNLRAQYREVPCKKKGYRLGAQSDQYFQTALQAEPIQHIRRENSQRRDKIVSRQGILIDVRARPNFPGNGSNAECIFTIGQSKVIGTGVCFVVIAVGAIACYAA